jgi:hypothetical protein
MNSHKNKSVLASNLALKMPPAADQGKNYVFYICVIAESLCLYLYDLNISN